MSQCAFCKKELPKGTGTMLIRKTGKFAYFCSGKCEKNALKLKRNPAKLKWAQNK